jgi:NDP-sugar pyrophosphorylase family protein
VEDAVALVMAGGTGQRMLKSGVRTPKPLVPIGGRTLLEHNVNQLLRGGFRKIHVSVSSGDRAVHDFATGILAEHAASGGAELSVLPEPQPLGNIGCAGLLRGRARTLLVVYADNLTTLDLAALVSHHHRERAALTLACHDHPFHIPYGRLSVHEGAVTGYTEKPSLTVTVCSAVSVLGEAALACLPPDRPTGLVDLTNTMLAAGERVGAFPHDAAWVDVNDTDGIRVAEDLVRRHPEDFGDAVDASVQRI